MLILTNFKHYPSAVFLNAHTLVKTHIAAQKKTGGNFAVAVGPLDIQQICTEYAHQIDIFAQHCDNASFGSSTGKIVPEMLVQMGVKGVIVNHSENRFNSSKTLIETIAAAKNCGLIVVCCAETAEEGQYFAQSSIADYIAVEPPELIGGDVSVATARPELIEESVASIGKGKTMVGAGIKTGKDVLIASQKGATGVLLASGVTKASDPESVLCDLVSGLQ